MMGAVRLRERMEKAMVMISKDVKRGVLAGILGGFAFILAACNTTGKTPPLAENTKPEEATPKPEAAVALKDEECPAIQILEGTGILTAYAGEGEEKPENISHQATIIRSGRTCSIVDGALTLQIGAAGRAARGPKAIGASATLPIRIAVVRGESEVLFSQLYNQVVPLKEGAAQDFSLVEEAIRIPGDKKDNIKILVGFDTFGVDKAAG